MMGFAGGVCTILQSLAAGVTQLMVSLRAAPILLFVEADVTGTGKVSPSGISKRRQQLRIDLSIKSQKQRIKKHDKTR